MEEKSGNQRGIEEFRLSKNRLFVILLILLLSNLLFACRSSTETGTGDEQVEIGMLQLTQAAMDIQQTQISIEQTQISLEQTQLALTVASADQMVSTETLTPTQEVAAVSTPTTEITRTPDVRTEIEENSFNDDFTVNSGRFSTTEGITIENGALYMGEFERCAEFDSDQPVGCISVCQVCGDHFANYEVKVESVYAEGITERLFGLVLRFLDENGNHRIDHEDYFLGWVFSVNHTTWYLYEHKSNQVRPWILVKCGPSHIRSHAYNPNYLRVVSSKEGERIDIYMNDDHMVRVVSTRPIPGEVYVEDMPDYGDIGLWVAERGIRVLFDNYSFTNMPNEP